MPPLKVASYPGLPLPRRPGYEATLKVTLYVTPLLWVWFVFEITTVISSPHCTYRTRPFRDHQAAMEGQFDLDGDKLGASPSYEHQCFDSSRVSCCYFSRSDDARDKLTKNAHYPVGQGILFQLYSDCNQARDEASDKQLIILTSYQLVSSLSTARDWVLGFCETKKQFSLASYIDQQQVRVITCCGSSDGESLWDCRRTHLETMCPMRSDCSILLLGPALTRDILSEFSASLCIFTVDDIMPLKSAEGILLSGSATVTVYHRTGSGSVLSSQFQTKKSDDLTKVGPSFLLSTRVDWYLENCSRFSYEKTAHLPVTGAPIIYREPNSGKPLLLGMHVYLESQKMQYGVSIGHILELLQCKHIFGPQVLNGESNIII